MTVNDVVDMMTLLAMMAGGLLLMAIAWWLLSDPDGGKP